MYFLFVICAVKLDGRARIHINSMENGTFAITRSGRNACISRCKNKYAYQLVWSKPIKRYRTQCMCEIEFVCVLKALPPLEPEKYHENT